MIEPSFRRVNKRARIAEIQNELEELKNTVKRSSGPINSRASSEYSDSHPSFLAPEANNRNGTYSPGPSSYGSPYTRSDEYRQGSIAGRFDSIVEEDLFMTFFTKFHPTLPIVDNTLSPAATYNICPLLYHTILLLATLATSNHPLTWSLTQTVNTAAPQHVLSPNKSVHLVQAYLLLATWPQTHPQGSTLHDQAWMYVGVATHMAQTLGLHRSFLSSEYASNQNETNEHTRREWVRTWVGCFIVSQFLSTALGVNPIITEDFTIQNAPALLSPTTSSAYDPALSLLLDKLKMARVGARITGLLSSCPNSSSGLAEVGDNLAIFRVLQGDVQEVEASLLNADEARGLSFLWVKTQLYSYALHDGMLPQAARTEFVLRDRKSVV